MIGLRTWGIEHKTPPPMPMQTMASYLARKPLFSDLEELNNLIEYATNQANLSRANNLRTRTKFDTNPGTVEIEVPGVAPSDVKVRVEGRTLRVESPKGNTFLTLDQKHDVDRATASMRHGLLTISIPKKESKLLEISVFSD